jgi:hypothetical protein
MARMATPNSSDPTLPSHCPNCQAKVYGPYCSQCGQETVIARLRFRDFSHEYFQNFVSLEGRLWRSLWLLLVRPGQLTLEFIAGRRRRYVRPIPLYLTLSFLVFLLLNFSSSDSLMQLDGPEAAPTGVEAVVLHAKPPREISQPHIAARPTIGDQSELQGLVTLLDQLPGWLKPVGQRYYISVQRLHDDPQRGVERLVSVVMAKLPYAIFVLVPVFAVITRLLYWRRDRAYSEHFLFALHLHAFVFLTLIAAFWLGADLAAPLLFLCWLVYLALALRRVFGGRWWPQVLRALGLIMGHSVLLGAISALTIIASLPAV